MNQLPKVNLDLKLNPKQTLCWKYLSDSTTNEIGYGGGAGGGKSFIGCAWLIINCYRYPKTRWLMGRAELDQLKKSTLNTFFDICSQWNIIAGRDFNYNINDKIITFENGSQILLYDLKLYPSDPNFDSLGSIEITGAFIDEANQIVEKAKNIVMSRIRYKLQENNLYPKLLLTCNPSKGWIYDEFYKKYREGKLEDYRKFVSALVTDNPKIDPSYIQSLNRLDEVSKKRLLYGLWEYESVGLIPYDSIMKMFDVQDYLEQPNNTYYLSIDVARLGKDKTVIVLWKGLNIQRIFTLVKSTIDNTVNKIKEIIDTYKIHKKNIVVDTDGVGGGVADYLKGCASFVNNSRALNNENFQNLKTQCYYKLADFVNSEKIKVLLINPDVKEDLIRELELIKPDKLDMDTRLCIMSKDKVKEELGRSPDYSDAIMMRMFFELRPSSYGKYVFSKLSLSR